MTPAPRSSPAPRGALVLVLALGLVLPAPHAATRPAIAADRAMVVSPEAHATEVALAVLAAGGNAVDAAVAGAFALAVTDPMAGSLGGGGFLLVRTPEGEHHALDFREVAPSALRPELFLDEEGRPVEGRSLRHGLAVGVPGAVAGLAEAHARWGSRPWKELVVPAVRLAEEGFVVGPYLATQLAEHHELLAGDPGTRAIFLPHARPPREGERLVQRDLGATLAAIAEHGPRAFYTGRVAEALAGSVQAAGGVLTEEDLAAYRPATREPLVGRYRGHRVVTFPPPSSGGIALLQILAMLERHDLEASGFGSSLTVHRMAEAMRRAFADRARWLGDPDFVEVPLDRLLDPDHLEERARSIRDRRATPSRRVGPAELPPAEGQDTLHLSVADPRGGAVALTTTLNTSFGTGLVAGGTGVLLNNEMDDFALAPGVPNVYGLVGGAENAVAGGKRPLSSMTPAIVEPRAGGPRPLLVLGSPGGPRIITAVLQVLVNVIDHDLPLQAAVDAPRFHHQWLPDAILHEPLAFPVDVERGLRRRGHELREAREPLGNVNAIGLDADGRWLGAPDPRRLGVAGGL